MESIPYNTDHRILHQFSSSSGEAGSLLINYRHQEQLLELTWEGEVTPADLRAGYRLVIEYVKALKPKQWLLDLHKRSIIRHKDRLWVVTNIFPKVLRLVEDDVFVALILPLSLQDTLVHNLKGDELMAEKGFLIMQHFLLREEAQRWLEHMQLLKKGERSTRLCNMVI